MICCRHQSCEGEYRSNTVLKLRAQLLSPSSVLEFSVFCFFMMALLLSYSLSVPISLYTGNLSYLTHFVCTIFYPLKHIFIGWSRLHHFFLSLSFSSFFVWIAILDGSIGA